MDQTIIITFFALCELCLSVNQSTRYYFNAERIGMMNSDSILINTGRGALMDEKALYTALSSQRLKAADSNFR